MKKLLFSFSAVMTMFFVNAQDGIVIYQDGTTTDVSSGNGVINMVAPSYSQFDVLIDVENNTGSTQTWRIARKRLDVPTGWTDGLCWGHCTDPFGGTCYSSTQMSNNYWVSPGTQTVLFDILDGECGKLKPQINPENEVSGTAHYRYYLTTNGSVYGDSVDVVVDWTAAIKQIEAATISIQPNPASDYVNITLNNTEQASMKIVDVLGNVVMKETISGTRKIDVADFKNGVYFIMIETTSGKSISRKLIVRH
jgi:hypothetical protein